MTFNEYISQEKASNLPIGSVSVTEKDAFSVINSVRDTSTTLVILKFNPIYHYYIVHKNNVLYSMDDEGNPDKPSVFKFVEHTAK